MHAIGSASEAVLRVTCRFGVLFVVLVGLGLTLASGADAYVYWADGSTIGRANPDGTGVNESFITGTSGPFGVAVDAGHIYWANNTDGTIGRANLDGTSVNESFITGATRPSAVAVDASHVYWANSTNGTIGRANLDGTSVNENFITGAISPSGIAVDASYVYWSNNNFPPTIGRATLDGTGVNQGFVGAIFSTYGIAVDASHIYWTDPVLSAIGRANINGTGANSFITGVEPWALAVDAGHVYWGNDNSAIGRANIDGTSPNPSFIPNPNRVLGVAVDSLGATTATVALTPSSDPIVYGQPSSFTATVAPASPQGSSPAPTGTVQFQTGGLNEGTPVTLDANGQANFNPLLSPDVGATVTAQYNGDATYGATRTDLKPNIQPASTMTSLTASPNPANPGAAVTFNATVTNTSSGVVPFGSVQFVVDGEPVLGPLPLEENGEAGIAGEGVLAAGDHVVQAFYHDDTGPIPDFTDSQASVTEHITSPPPPAKPAPSPPPLPPPSPPPLQATLSVFPLAPTVHNLLRGGFTDSVVLTGPGSVSENLFSDNGALPATASRASAARHKKSKRHQAAVLLAKGGASTATTGTVTVTLLPTAAGRKTLKKTRHSLRVVLITSVKDTRTGKVTNLPPHTLTLKH
jgi:virginiamycin B lyase